ncbi:MAG: DMT family transporter, partial [Myxococcota bacterium]
AAQLVFALILGTFFMGHRATGREWLGAVAVTLGLAGFIVGTDPSPGHPEASWSGWLLATGFTLLAVLFCLGAGARQQGSARSALYGTAAGLCWGFMIVLMKVVTHRLGEGSGWSEIATMFGHFSFYGLIVTAIFGFLLLQKAFQAGSLSHALVSYTVVEIVLAVLLGITLFGEKPHSTAASLTLTSIASLLMLVGIVFLARARGAATDRSP